MYHLCAVFAITGTAVLAGIMVSVGYILGPYWLTLEGQAFRQCFRSTGGRIVAVLPFVLAPSIGGVLGASAFASPICAGVRALWALSGCCIVSVMLATRYWFFPRNDRMLAEDLAVVEQRRLLRYWLRAHNARIALLLLAAAFGLSALLWGRAWSCCNSGAVTTISLAFASERVV